ncbi:Abi family protein [Spirosoma sordidisoli]|uniref:Abi family protein n=1 Tax=Spirosoma sordidisoli TaxID=2502893 RepID=A0A4Q2UN86_9BACT|nr:Abi family protein [Spirosoma sordidisoli]PHK27951.1 CAAX protease [Nostoc linckia z16]RYC69221.1 Abi family protein [Spirosoma sordidisoli]
MSKVPYRKPALTYQDQLNRLKGRGLIVHDDVKALHLLAQVSYYRLSGYWYPLLDNKQTHRFKPGATFETGFRLYCFDRELRKLVLAELEKIEVAIRAHMIYVLSHRFGPFWFTDTTLFTDTASHTRTISSLMAEYSRSDEEFIRAFRQKYNDPLPPSWMMLEVASFGSLSMLYKNLNTTIEKRQIASYFGLDDGTFASWLHCIVYLRNVCAHHSRLWNRVMSIQPRIPKNPRKPWLINPLVSNNRTYFALSMILFLLSTVNPNHRFLQKLSALFHNYPEVDKNAMGFEAGWDNEPLWQ